MNPMERGVTLLELMIASAIAAVIMLGLGFIEGTRARVTEGVRQGVVAEPERKNAALAAVRIAKDLETSDRFDPPTGTGLASLNVRIPDCPTPVTPACLDSAANYQWVQYTRNAVANELRMYRFPRTPWPPVSCPAAQVLATGITALSFTFDSTPGNVNALTYALTWTSGTRTQTFQGQVIPRFRPAQLGVTGLETTASATPGVTCP